MTQKALTLLNYITHIATTRLKHNNSQHKGDA